jgi:hypothetical protein
MKEDYSGLIYVPPPVKPSDFERKFAEIVGVNPETGEPFCRIVYGMDHKRLVNGEMEIWYIDPNGRYVGMPYLIFESWSPPTVYDRQEWENIRYKDGIDAMGPFPEKGVWDFVRPLRNENFEALGYEAAYPLAREWRYNRNNAPSRQHSVKQAEAFYAKRMEKKREAEAEMLRNQRQELAEELAKDVRHADMGFSIPTDLGERNFTKKELKDLRARGRALGGPTLPAPNTVVTPAGLIVKKDALPKGN